MKTLQIFSIIFLAGSTAFGQYTFEGVEKLASTINSEEEEITPMLSPDGSRLYFVRAGFERNIGGSQAGQDIWFSDRASDGGWTEPSNALPEINNGDNNAMTGFTANGDTIFLINNYSSFPRRKIGLSYTVLKNGKWTTPKEQGVEVKTKNDFYGMYVHRSQQVTIVSMMGDEAVGEEDLYVSLRKPDGSWSDAKHLGSVINSAGFEISPFLSEDQTTLFFASNGHGGFGDADIFMSSRQDDSWSNWSVPVNLGDKVNSAAFDAYYFEQNGSAYFSSNRDGGKADIFFMSATKLLPIDEELLIAVAETEPEEMETKIPIDEGSYDVIPEPLSVYFGFDSFVLSTESKSAIEKVAKLLSEQGAMNIEVNGYADPIGSSEYNQVLSKRRALAVSDYLTNALGVAKPRLVIVEGKGEVIGDGFAQTTQRASEARKVEIVFVRNSVAAQ
ncbi:MULTISPECIES: OmpA family protein [unclassified Imperialibacter]|uniref:OmpA family protein n=1 Tax=unclassified Imperialibacter TaxID=2629706 RepID=UPI001250D924|nr:MULTISPECIES: OmpA family protein [unclassified Imperialibacter]CAD5267504.1 OmpA family protein [Imperialibacter sp. 75]CAD5279822.1 OmpA family protein [Imperialibacter sp. 89]VVT01070.1 OmpA family protein [Imperialibacter sp. EC-SDR9]